MRRYAVVDKSEGETPLVALERFRVRDGIGNVPMTYAGRLDPMASGKLLLLIGDECKRRSAYDNLDKAYEFEILSGFTSDTGDILGLATPCARPSRFASEHMQKVAQSFRGRQTLPYPAFSSKTVGGVPLFEKTLRGELLESELPHKEVRIHDIRFLGTRTVSAKDILRDVEERLALLKVDEASENPYKDFRRDDILAGWRELLHIDEAFSIARMSAIVSSGTYIRSLAPLIAERVGTCGLAYSIRRSRIGRYVHFGRFGLWLRSY